MTQYLITFEDGETGLFNWLKITCDKLKADLDSDCVIRVDGVRIEIGGPIVDMKEIERGSSLPFPPTCPSLVART